MQNSKAFTKSNQKIHDRVWILHVKIAHSTVEFIDKCVGMLSSSQYRTVTQDAFVSQNIEFSYYQMTRNRLTQPNIGQAWKHKTSKRRVNKATHQNSYRAVADRMSSASSFWIQESCYRIFCVACRVMNSLTEGNVFLIACMDDFIESLGWGADFSTLDAASVYRKVEIENEGWEKTSFTKHHGP